MIRSLVGLGATCCLLVYCSEGNLPDATTDLGSADPSSDGGAAAPDAADAADAGPDAASIEKDKLGPSCADGGSRVCEAGFVCYDLRSIGNYEDPDLAELRCAPEPICDIVICPAGKVCGTAESVPPHVLCL